MIVKVSFEVLAETEAQDRYLRVAMERMATGQHSYDDIRLVTQTYKARINASNLRVQTVQFDDIMKQR